MILAIFSLVRPEYAIPHTWMAAPVGHNFLTALAKTY